MGIEWRSGFGGWVEDIDSKARDAGQAANCPPVRLVIRVCGIWGDAFGSEKRLWAQICTGLDEGRLGRIGFGRLSPHDESCGGISAARGAGWTIMMGIMRYQCSQGRRLDDHDGNHVTDLADRASLASLFLGRSILADNSGIFATFGLAGGAASSARHSASFFRRARLARKPNCRMRTKPAGTMWRRKRRMNSTASSVIILVWLPPA